VSRTLFFFWRGTGCSSPESGIYTHSRDKIDFQIVGPRSLRRRELTLRIHSSGVSSEPHCYLAFFPRGERDVLHYVVCQAKNCDNFAENVRRKGTEFSRPSRDFCTRDWNIGKD
jgi:hypothetical protein